MRRRSMSPAGSAEAPDRARRPPRLRPEPPPAARGEVEVPQVASSRTMCSLMVR